MKRLIVGLIALTIAVASCNSTRAGLIIDDAIFAHDFEQISGSTITALVGPNATITSTSAIVPSTTDPRSGSTQHITPISSGNGGEFVNTNAYLVGSTSELSFSIFYNDRGDNGGDWVNGINHAVLVGSLDYSSSGNGVNFTTLDSDTGRTLRFGYHGVIDGMNQWTHLVDSTATIPNADSTWHQAGFVYQGGGTDPTVTFYFDGEMLGNPVALPGLSEISSVDAPWTFIEDYEPFLSISGDEYYDNGFYDDAALWARALSADEMNALYQDGITASAIPASAIPEPSTLVIWSLLGALGITVGWYRRRKSS